MVTRNLKAGRTFSARASMVLVLSLLFPGRAGTQAGTQHLGSFLRERISISGGKQTLGTARSHGKAQELAAAGHMASRTLAVMKITDPFRWTIVIFTGRIVGSLKATEATAPADTQQAVDS
jgi:hypothetical protein